MDVVTQIADGWSVIKNAPGPVLGLMAAAAVAAWWLKGQITKGKAEAADERLKLAAEKYDYLLRSTSKLEPTVKKFQEEVIAHADPGVLAGTSSSVTANLIEVKRALREVGTSLSTRSLTSASIKAEPSKWWSANADPLGTSELKAKDEKKG